MAGAFKRVAARAAILMLAAWFGGLSCLLGCEDELASATATSAETTPAECPHHGGPNLPGTPDTPDPHKSADSKCCPLSNVPPVAKRLSAKHVFVAFDVTPVITLPAAARDAMERGTSQSLLSEDIHLRLCILRI